jgi:hypothetical protein
MILELVDDINDGLVDEKVNLPKEIINIKKQTFESFARLLST